MKTYINLLPWRFRRRMLVRLRLFQWATIWGLCMAISIGAVLVKYRLNAMEQARLDARRRADSRLFAQHRENAEITAGLAELHRRLAHLQSLENKEYPLNLLALVSDSTLHSDRQIQIREMTFNRSVRAAAAAAAGSPAEKRSKEAKKETPPQEISTLTLKGVARNDLAIAKLVVRLRDSGVFDQVDLKSSVGEEVAGRKMRKYLVECTF